MAWLEVLGENAVVGTLVGISSELRGPESLGEVACTHGDRCSVSLRSLFPITLVTPSTALPPHVVSSGPRMTASLSLSSAGRSSTSENTPENVGECTLCRSSTSRSLLLNSLFNPRALSRPHVRFNLRHVQPGYHSKKVGDICRVRATDILLGDHQHGRCGQREFLPLLRARSKFHIHQVLVAHFGKLSPTLRSSPDAGGHDAPCRCPRLPLDTMCMPAAEARGIGVTLIY
jgi:hypothetical protein